MNITKLCIIAIFFSFLLGCQSDTHEEISQKEANQLFVDAKKDIAKKRYHNAIENLELIQLNYPQYTEYDQLLYLIAKAQFNHKDYLEAQGNAHEYIISNPTTHHTEEMLFVEAMSQYLVNENWLGDRFLSPRYLRDTSYLEKAKTNFLKFRKKYPSSKYIKDVNKALIKINDVLASEALEIAKYNYVHKAYLGAIQRAELVIKNYPNTKQHDDALKVMDDSFNKLSLTDEYKELKLKLNHIKA